MSLYDKLQDIYLFPKQYWKKHVSTPLYWKLPKCHSLITYGYINVTKAYALWQLSMNMRNNFELWFAKCQIGNVSHKLMII
jgi:hypothetical protein